MFASPFFHNGTFRDFSWCHYHHVILSIEFTADRLSISILESCWSSKSNKNTLTNTITAENGTSIYLPSDFGQTVLMAVTEQGTAVWVYGPPG